MKIPRQVLSISSYSSIWHEKQWFEMGGNYHQFLPLVLLFSLSTICLVNVIQVDRRKGYLLRRQYRLSSRSATSFDLVFKRTILDDIITAYIK